MISVFNYLSAFHNICSYWEFSSQKSMPQDVYFLNRSNMVYRYNINNMPLNDRRPYWHELHGSWLVWRNSSTCRHMSKIYSITWVLCGNDLSLQPSQCVRMGCAASSHSSAAVRNTSNGHHHPQKSKFIKECIDPETGEKEECGSGPTPLIKTNSLNITDKSEQHARTGEEPAHPLPEGDYGDMRLGLTVCIYHSA